MPVPPARIRAAFVARFAAGLLAGAALPASAGEPPAWQVVGAQGLVQVVIVPDAQVRDAEAYQAQIARLCPPGRTCFVNFYENPTGARAELPLPDAIAEQATARFRRSMKNGGELFQWSCRVEPNPDGAPCF